MKIPPFSGLRAFETVARRGSIRKAAAELNVDHTVISRQVRGLEQNLAVRLVKTSRRGVELTEAGRQYAKVLSASFLEITEATNALRSKKKGTKTLRIMSVPGFASKYLLPKLSDFRSLAPGVEIVLTTTGLDQDLKSFDADILIQLVPFGDISRFEATEILRPRIFPVASRHWIETHPEFNTPESLLRAPLIHELNLDRWYAWFRACGVSPREPLSGLHIGQAHLVVEAAKRGYGVALSNSIIGLDDLQSGDLREIGQTNVMLEYYVMKCAAGLESPAAEKFCRWILETVE